VVPEALVVLTTLLLDVETTGETVVVSVWQPTMSTLRKGSSPCHVRGIMRRAVTSGTGLGSWNITTPLSSAFPWIA